MQYSHCIFCKVHSMSQSPLGDELQFETMHLGKIKNAKIGSSFEMLFRIAEALNGPAYTFLGFRDMKR